jgi:hypothetical protein
MDRVELREWRGLVRLGLDDQRGRHAEHHVAVDILVAALVERGHQFAVAVGGDQEVDMGRAVAVAGLGLDQAADRTVHRNEGAERRHCAEVEFSVRVTHERAALHIVDAVLVGVTLTPFAGPSSRAQTTCFGGANH